MGIVFGFFFFDFFGLGDDFCWRWGFAGGMSVDEELG